MLKAYIDFNHNLGGNKTKQKKINKTRGVKERENGKQGSSDRNFLI